MAGTGREVGGRRRCLADERERRGVERPAAARSRAATAGIVRSSWVTPSPPVVITRSIPAASSARTVSAISLGLVADDGQAGDADPVGVAPRGQISAVAVGHPSSHDLVTGDDDRGSRGAGHRIRSSGAAWTPDLVTRNVVWFDGRLETLPSTLTCSPVGFDASSQIEDIVCSVWPEPGSDESGKQLLCRQSRPPDVDVRTVGTDPDELDLDRLRLLGRCQRRALGRRRHGAGRQPIAQLLRG